MSARAGLPPERAGLYMIHHVFLPPKLPSAVEKDGTQCDKFLTASVIEALGLFREKTADGEHQRIIGLALQMMEAFHDSVEYNGDINEESVRRVLSAITATETGFVVLPIRAQNAAILISKNNGVLDIETFELSARNHDVVSTVGRLRRSFPDRAVRLEEKKFNDPDFRNMLCQTIRKMNEEAARDTAAKVQKAHQSHVEIRDTISPELVNGLLVAVLLANGEPVTFSRIQKNTRDEVLWDASRVPWRRSPVWLMIRVALQLVFSRMCPHTTQDSNLYKQFMIILMGNILARTLACKSIENDLLHTMTAKLDRRILKIGQMSDTLLSCLDNAICAMHKAEDQMKKTWNDIRKKFDGADSANGYPPLEELNFRADTDLTIPNLDEYVESIAARDLLGPPSIFQPSRKLTPFSEDTLPRLLGDNFSSSYQHFELHDFEIWVERNLARWSMNNRSKPSTCGDLLKLMHDYHGTAKVKYANNPERTSIMLLTLMELWIACDISATSIHMLLREYSCEVPHGLLDWLLLPSRKQLGRLREVENYLAVRERDATRKNASIFRAFGTADCFPVHFFQQSTKQQSLLRGIESDAAKEKKDKIEELRKKKEEFESLMEKSERLACSYIGRTDWKTGRYRTVHDHNCQKCKLKAQAKAMRIYSHEWPLPDDRLKAQSVVFELQAPDEFCAWRDATFFLIADVLKCNTAGTEAYRIRHRLSGYISLRGHYERGSRDPRLGLMSVTDPNLRTHRYSKGSPVSTAKEIDVILKSGMTYKYFELKKETCLAVFSSTDHVTKVCTYKLPSAAQPLQRFLFRPTPNTVMAKQSECPDEVTIEEFRALAKIPLGERVQWQNILVELSMPGVNWLKTHAGLFALQAMYQAGPLGGGSPVERAGHMVLADGSFAHALLDTLDVALGRIEENWESYWALAVLIWLACRLASVNLDKDVRSQCLGFLARTRATARKWGAKLGAQASESSNDKQRAEFKAREFIVALVCICSFDLDPDLLDTVLSDETESTTFFQCSITIEEKPPSPPGPEEYLAQLLFERWQRICYRARGALTNLVLGNHDSSLDHAIKQAWPPYVRRTQWSALPTPYSHWLTTTAGMAETESQPLTVHYNTVTAEFLVNGLSLSHCPEPYRSHPMYQVLFGGALVEVMPTSIPGMAFSAKKIWHGQIVHFGLRLSSAFENPDFVLQAVDRNRGRTYDLLPHRLFNGKVPDAFSKSFVHWYSHEEGAIEFRPRKTCWESNARNWRLVRSEETSTWRLEKQGDRLVNICSPTAQQICQILSPLQKPGHIHIILRGNSTGNIEVDIPRLRLDFSLLPGASRIESRQFRGMWIDPDQTLGALVGLRDKLILRGNPLGVGEKHANRMVLIPEGEITINAALSGHVQVSIDQATAVRYQAYHVDDQIGTLGDNGNLQSRLFLCYLHAVTAHCLPDPLTGLTGTEQALSILRSPATRSFDTLSEDNISMLEHIFRLSPKRTHYPAHLRQMQNVAWNSSLSFLSQHDSFALMVTEIQEQAKTACLFDPGLVQRLKCLETLGQANRYLNERARIRDSTFRQSGSGAEDHTTRQDSEYRGRDQCDKSLYHLERAFKASKFIVDDTFAGKIPFPASDNLHRAIWQFLAAGEQISVEESSLSFSQSWLESTSKLLRKHWCWIHASLATSAASRINKFQVSIWLATLAYSSEGIDMGIIQTLGSFFHIPKMTDSLPPRYDAFDLSRGHQLMTGELEKIVEEHQIPFHDCPEALIPQLENESEAAAAERRQSTFEPRRVKSTTEVIAILRKQWPCLTPVAPTEAWYSEYLEIHEIMSRVREMFAAKFKNLEFYQYLSQVATTMGGLPVQGIALPSFPSFPPKTAIHPTPIAHRFLTWDIILECEAPTLPTGMRFDSMQNRPLCEDETGKKDFRLADLVDRVKGWEGRNIEQRYADALELSLARLKSCGSTSLASPDQESISVIKDELKDYVENCQQRVTTMHTLISTTLEAASEAAPGSGTVPHQKPRLTRIAMLQQLRQDRWEKLSASWKHCFLEYALALVDLQRAERLWSLVDKPVDFYKELQNRGHEDWSPHDHPEWLLLEVESGIVIRKVQHQIAIEMMHPPSDRNKIMQLNMGEGKSSVIVPMVASALADGSQLARVIVAKPQSKQMFQMLVSKVGGLLGRRVYHMPFSRAVKLTSEIETAAIQKMCEECQENKGILLVQPEHLLSFQLMGIECLATERELIGRRLLQTQHFFDTTSRDIVDESDENFSVKFELVYTMGAQRSIELSPDRWTIIQHMLGLVAKKAPRLQKDFPDSIELYQHSPGHFPRIRLLRSDAAERLVEDIATSCCTNGFPGLSVASQSDGDRKSMFTYLTKTDLTAEEISDVEAGPLWVDSKIGHLLLARGLLAGGVLSFVLGNKRWRVNYGLDTARQPPTQLAVPYRAKDSPSPRSEFSHPDVVIALTLLSYYYGGLTDTHLFVAFDHLLKSDQPEVEYQDWVDSAPGLPSAFRQLGGVSLKDSVQCTENIFPALRYSKGAVDYFLSHIAFPKYMKEFPYKLSASGWDIARNKKHPTTGFSGTNDSRHVLPLDIEQLDLPEQEHTNALVLEHLLQPENSVHLLPGRYESLGRSDAEVLLTTVTSLDPPVRVILDVGAVILELDNRQVAQEWLRLVPESTTPEIHAVVFVNEDDELTVIDRKGVIEPLQTSPFAKQLGQCMVFLDEAHTRGIDLKLPIDYRAAVTLGANLVKDRLVQACMRMRNLGKGQSVVFCISEEIQTKISSRHPPKSSREITVSDVLDWSMSETILDLRKSMPLWAAQGLRFEKQKELWDRHRTDDSIEMDKDAAEKFLEEEAQSLEYRYRPGVERADLPSPGDNSRVNRIIERCGEFGSLGFASATLQEEQERELSPEVEEERQVEKPPEAKPHEHSIDPLVREFVQSGILPAGSGSSFVPAFRSLRDTAAATSTRILPQFPSDLLVTADFNNTIALSVNSGFNKLDDYKRPVQFILTSPGKVEDQAPSGELAGTQPAQEEQPMIKHMVIISPFEAQHLLSEIRQHKKVTMHLYAPRRNKALRPLDDLNLFNEGRPFSPTQLPHRSKILLNLFAGQLYFDSFAEYKETCELLGLVWRAGEPGVIAAADGFIVHKDGGSNGSGFTESPVKCLQALMTVVRRHGEGIDKTHVGDMLSGHVLTEDDFV